MDHFYLKTLSHNYEDVVILTLERHRGTHSCKQNECFYDQSNKEFQRYSDLALAMQHLQKQWKIGWQDKQFLL